MRIERLRIENFRRFRQVDIELADGVTAVVGRNGAGKSTLLEAIGWCLYGNEAARTGKDLLKRRGAGPGDDVRVHLAFRMGPHVYEVTRELLGKSESHSATVKCDGKVVVSGGAQSGKEATAYIERAFHMDRAAFFTSLVARQRELAALTNIGRADRKRILIGLLRLDAVDTAITEARQRKRDARSELMGIRAGMQDPAPLRESLQRVRTLIENDKARAAELDARVAALVDEVEDVRARRDSGRKLADEHKSLLAEIGGCDERLALTRNEHARQSVLLQRARAAAIEALQLAPQVEALPAARERVEALTARAEQAKLLAQVRGELARATADAAAAEQELAAARESLAVLAPTRTMAERIARERPEVEARVAALQKRVTEIESGAKQTAKLLNELSAKERRVRDIGPAAPCPTCTRPLGEHYDELLRGFGGEAEALRVAIEHARPELDAARAQEAEARQALAALVARDAELRAKLQRLAADEARAGAAAARLSDAQARAARMREQEGALAAAPFDPKELEAARLALRALESAQQRHARASAEAEREKEIAPRLAELAAQEQAHLAQRSDAERRRALLGFDPAAHDALEKAAQAAEARLTEARVAREKALGERLLREHEERTLASQLAAIEALASRAAELERRVTLLEALAADRDGGLLPEFKDHLIGRTRPLLSLHAGRLFRELCEGRYADLEVDEGYDLLVHDEGQPFPLERFSGGEADLANLCLRLAVSQVVAERAGSDGFHFLALDEIFGSQDDVRKANILRALKALSGRFRQILLITHIADVKESAEHVLRIEALDDGTSRIVAET